MAPHRNPITIKGRSRGGIPSLLISPMSSTSSQLPPSARNHEYKRAPSGSSRSPCPALNALANHGFIHRAGSDLKFFEVLQAIVLVYNFSYPLAFLLTSGGFITCGKVSFNKGDSISVPLKSDTQTTTSLTRQIILALVTVVNALMRLIPSITLDLDALAARGHFKITHDAALVHPNEKSSTAPDPALLKNFLDYALEMKNTDGSPKHGLGLPDLSAYHATRCRASAPLDNLHAEIGLGECSLAWEVLATRPWVSGKGKELSDGVAGEQGSTRRSNLDGVIPVSRLEQWFGEERLPDGWWDVDGVRPVHAVGFWRTKRLVNLINKLGM